MVWRRSLFIIVAVVAVVAVVASGCGSRPRQIRKALPGLAERGETPTGSIALIFTRPARGVTVAVDGQLVIERAHTDSVVITGVTAGIAEVRIAAGSGPARLERDVRVDVEVGRTTTIPLGAPDPPESPGYFNAAFSLVAIVLSTAVTNWLF